MSLIQANDISVVLGMRGSGKSTLSRKLASCFGRLVVFDRLQEHTDGVIVNDFRAFSGAWKTLWNKKNFKIIIQFDIEEKSEEQDAFFSEVLRVCYKSNRLMGIPLCILIEEVHFYAAPTSINKWLFECVLTGRHSKLSIIANSQRPASIHKALISQANNIFIGQLYEMRDIDYLEKTVGSCALNARSLPKYNFIHYRVGSSPKIIS